MRDTNGTLPDTAFWRRYNGRFAGFPTWAGFDAFWSRFAATGGEWYVFDPTGDAPSAPHPDPAAAFAQAVGGEVMKEGTKR